LVEGKLIICFLLSSSGVASLNFMNNYYGSGFTISKIVSRLKNTANKIKIIRRVVAHQPP
jgi:hypothetical protein